MSSSTHETIFRRLFISIQLCSIIFYSVFYRMCVADSTFPFPFRLPQPPVMEDGAILFERDLIYYITYYVLLATS